MDSDRIDALGSRVIAAFPGERGRVLARFLATWLEPDVERDFFRCEVCRRKSGGMGVAAGENPFFGRAGGWQEAGGVRWLCLGCTSEADAVLGSRSLDGLLADVVRALRAGAVGAAEGEGDPAAAAAVEAGFAARPAIAVTIGDCFACAQTTRVAKGPHAALCARCAATALVAFERGSASTR